MSCLSFFGARFEVLFVDDEDVLDKLEHEVICEKEAGQCSYQEVDSIVKSSDVSYEVQDGVCCSFVEILLF
jgi:hypothetical protein